MAGSCSKLLRAWKFEVQRVWTCDGFLLEIKSSREVWKQVIALAWWTYFTGCDWLHESHQAALTEKFHTKVAHMRAHSPWSPPSCAKGRICVPWVAGLSWPLNTDVEQPSVSFSPLHVAVTMPVVPRLSHLFQLWVANCCLLNFHIMDDLSTLLVHKCPRNSSYSHILQWAD